MKLTLRVPLPPRGLSPNTDRNSARIAKSGTVAAYRESCGWDAKAAAGATWSAPEKARVSLTWCLKGSQGVGYAPRDADNAVAASKALLDGLRDARVIVDDTWAHMCLGAVDVDRRRGPYVEVTVEGA